jgi:hypothetical protein
MRPGLFEPLEDEIGFEGSRFIEDVLDSSGGYACGPERDLLSAILFDGIQTYLSHIRPKTTEERVKFQEVNNWIHRRGDGYVFSFDNVCEALGVDPNYLRIGLSNISHSGLLRGKRRAKSL